MVNFSNTAEIGQACGIAMIEYDMIGFFVVVNNWILCFFRIKYSNLWNAALSVCWVLLILSLHAYSNCEKKELVNVYLLPNHNNQSQTFKEHHIALNHICHISYTLVHIAQMNDHIILVSPLIEKKLESNHTGLQKQIYMSNKQPKKKKCY